MKLKAQPNEQAKKLSTPQNRVVHMITLDNSLMVRERPNTEWILGPCIPSEKGVQGSYATSLLMPIGTFTVKHPGLKS